MKLGISSCRWENWKSRFIEIIIQFQINFMKPGGIETIDISEVGVVLLIAVNCIIICY